MGLSMMARLLQVDPKTFARYADDFEDAIARGRARAQIAVGDALLHAAKKGNVVAIIWWEKTRLGYSDRVQNLNTNWDASGDARRVAIYLPANGREVEPAEFSIVKSTP